MLKKKAPSTIIQAGEIRAWKFLNVSYVDDGGSRLKVRYISPIRGDVWVIGQTIQVKSLPLDAEDKGSNPGIYSFKTEAFARMHYAIGSNLGVLAQIDIWGDVIEHKYGYRSQYASLVKLEREVECPGVTADYRWLRLRFIIKNEEILNIVSRWWGFPCSYPGATSYKLFGSITWRNNTGETIYIPDVLLEITDLDTGIVWSNKINQLRSICVGDSLQIDPGELSLDISGPMFLPARDTRKELEWRTLAKRSE